MKSIFLSPEPYPDRNGAPARKIRESKKVGEINELELLFKEAIQNSNDQRLSIARKLNFYIDIRKLTGSQKDVLRDVIENYSFSRSVKKVKFLQSLKKALEEESVYCLVFTDCGSKGLNGPSTASAASDDSNFINFFFKVGRGSGTNVEDGGSAGEGRGVFFLNSGVSSVLTYSRYQAGRSSSLKSRFFGMTLDEDFQEKGKNFTGHWYWGKKGRLNSSVPYEGKDADSLAKFFGLDNHLGASSGTSIAVLLPRYIENDQQAEKYVENMRDVVEKILWPHLIPDSKGKVSIEVRISSPLGTILKPDPTAKSSIAYKYADLYSKGLNPKSKGSHELISDFRYSFEKDGVEFSLEKGESLGTLNWSKQFKPRRVIDLTINELEDPTGIQEHKEYLTGIALFRTPKLVVQYYSAIPRSNEIEVFGYFSSSREANVFFRESENGSHDSWNPKKLQLALGHARPNPVRKIQSAIEEEVKNIVKTLPESNDSSLDVELMHEFGELLDFVGIGSRRKTQVIHEPPIHGPGRVAKAIQVKLDLPPELVERSNGFCRGIFSFKVLFDPSRLETDEFSLNFISQVMTIDGLENITSLDPDRDPQIIEIEKNGTPIRQDSLVFTSDSPYEDFKMRVHIKFPESLKIGCTYRYTDHGADPELVESHHGF